ncbi:MAG: hypothetical protein AB7P76_01645 [Candidatus Melainabacteria bacterium]
MLDDSFSNETKLMVARELVASYVRGEAGKGVKPEDLGSLLKQVYNDIDKAFPKQEKRQVGLGS